jgi:hypothetical protein
VRRSDSDGDGGGPAPAAPAEGGAPLCSFEALAVAKARCERGHEGEALEFAFAVLDPEGDGAVPRCGATRGGLGVPEQRVAAAAAKACSSR